MARVDIQTVVVPRLHPQTRESEGWSLGTRLVGLTMSSRPCINIFLACDSTSLRARASHALSSSTIRTPFSSPPHDNWSVGREGGREGEENGEGGGRKGAQREGGKEGGKKEQSIHKHVKWCPYIQSRVNTELSFLNVT